MVHFIGPEGSLNFILQPLSDPILLAEVLLAMLMALAVMLLSEIKGLPLRENLESVRESIERIRVVIGSYLRLTLGMFLFGGRQFNEWPKWEGTKTYQVTCRVCFSIC